jgi:hypothetical protein
LDYFFSYIGVKQAVFEPCFCWFVHWRRYLRQELGVLWAIILSELASADETGSASALRIMLSLPCVIIILVNIEFLLTPVNHKFQLCCLAIVAFYVEI